MGHDPSQSHAPQKKLVDYDTPSKPIRLGN